MWWAGSRSVDLYLGTRRIALCRADEVSSVQRVEGLEQAVAAGRDALGSLSTRASVRIWLSGGLCRPFLLPAAAMGARRDEAVAIANAMVRTRAGLEGPCELRIDGGGSGRGMPIGVAVQETSLDSVRVAFAGRRVLSIRPWWAAVLEATLRRDPSTVAMGVQDCDALTVIAGTQEAISIATTFAPVDSDEAASAAWSRALLMDEMPSGVQVFARLSYAPVAEVLHGAALGTLVEVVG